MSGHPGGRNPHHWRLGQEASAVPQRASSAHLLQSGSQRQAVPLSCRFLESYSVSEHVKTMVTLDSYISTFVSLTLLMGLVFQLPIISFFLAKMGVITHSIMTNYRKHAFILILIVAAIITPPDVMTLILVSFPLYILYEVSILVVKFSDR